ncbi:DMT family transporter [Roseomonas marmotae]|uniref:DMT family transporter n=1 Tax=Roseomonas marmotae TaxID=2768161 RepID=A0ABS3KA62_9PROT|nr:DMT family transporter [Roseomonas marmotae]MBO1074350.1 DMT family transporter [Roseomonas marmotae]QTI78099.1 DMT family transporter [Roseomonas marmotae]
MIRLADLRLLLVAVTLFGGAWPITKSALADATPLWFAVSRTLLGALVIGLLLAFRGELRLPRRRDWPSVLAVGFLQLGAYFALTHLAVALVPAGRTAVLANVTIFWLVPLSVIVLKEKVPGRRWLAAGLGLAGVLALAGPWAMGPGETSTFIGHLMLLAAAFLWSCTIIITRLYPSERPMLMNLPWGFLLGGVVLVPLALIREPLGLGGGIGPGALWQVVVIGCLVAPLGTWAVIEAGRRLPGAVSSVGFLLAPAIGVVVSTLWLGEALGWDVIIGGALICASVVVAASG